MKNTTQTGQKLSEWRSEIYSTLRHGGKERAMLKTVKRIQQPTQLKVVPKELYQTSHNAETKTSSLINIDPYPESGKPTKIDLKLYQLEDFE